MNEQISNLNWTKSWTTKYPLFFLPLFAEGYTTYALKNFGKKFFGTVVFEYQKGLATVFRTEDALLETQNFLAENAVADELFASSNIKRLFDYFDLIEKMKQDDVIFKDESNFNLFCDTLAESLCFYIMMLWTSDGIVKLDLPDSKKSKIIDACLEARHKTENFFPTLVNYCEEKLIAIDRKSELNLGEVVVGATRDEIIRMMENNQTMDKEKISERYLYSVITKKEDLNILYSDNAKKFIDKLFKFDKTLTEFKGTIAMKGSVQGFAKIIFRDEEMSKFKSGDILVTTMTRPEWLPVMNTSSAFITDAGGLLCHAAIVARELKKPCIIGAKIATKVLKDGDLVEVDAEKGVVRILKKA